MLWTASAFELVPEAESFISHNATEYPRPVAGGVPEFMAMPLDGILSDIATGKLKVPMGPTTQLSEIVVAHRWMEQNQAAGKIVVLTP